MKPLPYLFLIAFVIIACSDEQTPILNTKCNWTKKENQFLSCQ